MRLLSVVFALALVQADPLAEALKTIDEASLRAHQNFLASDELEGRAAGFPGNDKAVEYLVKEVKSYGLDPAGDPGGFTQEFTTRSGKKVRNVCALLPGSDAKLKEEYVAIGGHLDHVGRKGQAVGGQAGEPKDGDDIWNGADDNGSGTSAVLVAARAFAKARVRPKRSVLFLWWNAEESGLEGSRHWVANATRPIDKVVYYLNLDMVGRNPERPMDLEGVKNAEGDALEKILTAACEAEGLKVSKFDHYNEAMFRSDGVSFLWAGIPASMFFTSWHADYHRVGDHADKIAYANLAKIARVSFRVVKDVADLPEAPRLNVDTPLRGRPLRLRADDLDLGGKGGCRVNSVVEGSVLAQAGLQAGDVVCGFRGRELPSKRPVAEFWKLIQTAPADQELELDVLRGGEKKTLKVSWPRR
jgi:hypothetical protein